MMITVDLLLELFVVLETSSFEHPADLSPFLPLSGNVSTIISNRIAYSFDYYVK
jgi:hypothetical protein